VISPSLIGCAVSRSCWSAMIHPSLVEVEQPAPGAGGSLALQPAAVIATRGGVAVGAAS
jgi:hypothetical protein